MRHGPRPTRSRRLPAALISGLIIALPATAARADRIQLRGGGEIRGHVLDDLENPGGVRVLTANSPRPLSFSTGQITQVVPETDAFDEYVARSASLAQTAQAQHEMGLWCEQQGLRGPAQTHYRLAVELDKTFAPAHLKLGHVEHEGRWITYDELRRAEGLVLRDGKWVPAARPSSSVNGSATADEPAVPAASDLARWSREVRVLQQQYLSGNAPQRQEAEDRLAAIQDPAAIPALVQHFGKLPPGGRALLYRLLDTFPGDAAQAALLDRLLIEPEPTLWEQLMTAVVRRQAPEQIGPLVEALRSASPDRVGRAARALSRLGARGAVPRLIDALVKVEQRFVMVPIETQPVGPGAGGGRLGEPSFTSVVGQNYVANVEPVVGPGVIAFRPVIGTIGSGYSSGLGPVTAPGPTAPLPMLPRPVRFARPNPEVLAALEELTGRGFGFNVDAWKRWLRTSFQVETEPSRKVPQP